MKTAIILNGYACSGKSTALNYLADKFKMESVSTSQILHSTAEDLLFNLIGTTYDSYNRGNTIQLAASTSEEANSKAWTNRDFLIAIAEEVLVPNFGREIFGMALANRVVRSDSDYVLGETIGGIEWAITENALINAGVRIIKANIRSNQEKSGVDIRELFKFADFTINNPMNDSYFELLDSMVKDIMTPALV